MGTVHNFKPKNPVTSEMLDRLEQAEADLCKATVREIEEALAAENKADLRDPVALQQIMRLKQNASLSATLMGKLGLYSSAKRGVLNANMWRAGNYPADKVEKAEETVSRLDELREKARKQLG